MAILRAYLLVCMCAGSRRGIHPPGRNHWNEMNMLNLWWAQKRRQRGSLMRWHGSINSVMLNYTHTYTQPGSMRAYRVFPEYKTDRWVKFFCLFCLFFQNPLHHSLPLSPFLIHLGFPHIARHMFVRLLHNPAPLPSSHTSPTYEKSRSTAEQQTAVASCHSPPLLRPSFQQPPVTFQAGLSDSLGNSSSCLVLAYIFHAATELPPL